MSPRKRNIARGVITFHTPIHRTLFISENYIADSQDDIASVKSPSQPSVKSSNSRRNQRTGSNEAHNSSSSSQTLSQERRSCPSIRRIQAKMETKTQQTRDTVQHLLNSENDFVKELESFLNQHDNAEQRRRELLHKHWTERLWLPLQKQLSERVSSCGATDIKRRQNLYSHFLQHCNSKGYVFLDTYDQKEYDPLFHHLKKSHYVKMAEMKDRPKETWMTNSFEADSKNSSRQEDKLPHNFQHSLVSRGSAMSQASTQEQTPASFPVSTPTKTPTGNSTERRTLSMYPTFQPFHCFSQMCDGNVWIVKQNDIVSSRLDKVPCHIDIKDRRCRSDCWFFSRNLEL